jgi:hypothetical protein
MKELGASGTDGVQAERTGGTIQAEGTGGAASIAPLPALHAPSLPPGVGPQIDLESPGRSPAAEPFLARTPQRGGILGYGNARTGRMPPHGGSPSSGPLTGLPLRAPPPVPPAFRKQALEPGHQEPDPLAGIAAVEVVPRSAGEDFARSLERLERSVAAIRSVRPSRRGSAGRHQAVAAAAGPAGTGGARVAASLGVPAAESVRTSGRGVYVAGRASGARWDVDATVAAPGAGRVRDAGMDNGCGAGTGPKRRPLTPLQSVTRYSRQQAALETKIQDAPAPEASKPPEVQRVGVSGPGTKGMSTGTKGLSKGAAAPPAREFAGMHGRQDGDPTTEPDPESERRLLALRARITGLGGRFGTGARRRCGEDPTGALRPAPGPVEWRRENRKEQTRIGRGGDTEPPAPKGRGPAVSGERRDVVASRADDEGCALPQKYPARAGVAMRDSAAAEASEAAPPGSPGPAQDDEGIAAGRQAPPGQQAYPRQEGTDARPREEAAPGAGGASAPAGIPSRPPVVAAQGMGGPSGPLLLNAERMLKEEADARKDAQKDAEDLGEMLGWYGEEANAALENGRILERNAKLLGKLDRAKTELSGPEGTRHTATLAQAIRDAKAIGAEIRAQRDAADGSSFFGAAQLSFLDVAAEKAAAALARLERIEARIRVLGNMDRGTLRLRALEATHRAERDSHRAERRALRRERGGVFKTRQFAQVVAATERAAGHERRSTRYAAEAARMKAGAARDGALARADYHGSLAEAERHRASVARSHILAPELARAKGVREYLRAEREQAELNVFRATHEPQLESTDQQLKAVAQTDENGQLVADRSGNYTARSPKDAQKVRDLQRKQARLVRKLARRLGNPTRGPGGGRTWANINNWNARQRVLASGGAAVPAAFAGTPAGTLMAARRDPKLGPVARALIEAQINSLMSKLIAEASASSEAAFQAGLDAGLAMHNEKLSDEERAAAASTYADALAGAAKAVSDIENAIAEKRKNGAYFESGWGEHDEDQKKLAKAKELLAALQNVCNSHPACGQAKIDCEKQSYDTWYCRLVPSSGGGDKGDGSSTSSAGASGPGASAPVVPGGGEETDGKDGRDGADAEKPTPGQEVSADGSVETAEAGSARARNPADGSITTAEPRKEDEKEKGEKPAGGPVPRSPKPPPPGVFRTIGRLGGLVTSHARSVASSLTTALFEGAAMLDIAILEAKRREEQERLEESGRKLREAYQRALADYLDLTLKMNALSGWFEQDVSDVQRGTIPDTEFGWQAKLQADKVREHVGAFRARAKDLANELMEAPAWAGLRSVEARLENLRARLALMTGYRAIFHRLAILGGGFGFEWKEHYERGNELLDSLRTKLDAMWKSPSALQDDWELPGELRVRGLDFEDKGDLRVNLRASRKYWPNSRKFRFDPKEGTVTFSDTWIKRHKPFPWYERLLGGALSDDLPDVLPLESSPIHVTLSLTDLASSLVSTVTERIGFREWQDRETEREWRAIGNFAWHAANLLAVGRAVGTLGMAIQAGRGGAAAALAMAKSTARWAAGGALFETALEGVRHIWDQDRKFDWGAVGWGALSGAVMGLAFGSWGKVKPAYPTRVSRSGKLQELRPSRGGSGPRRWQNVRPDLATRVTRFFKDKRSFEEISREYHQGDAGGMALHHWLFRRSTTSIPESVRNAGFNLIEIPGWLNTKMGFAQAAINPLGVRVSWRAVELSIRGAVIAAPFGSAYLGARVGSWLSSEGDE